MKHRALVCAAALASVACASAPLHVSTPTSARAEVPTDDAVAARLATLPAPPLAWSTPLRAATADELAAVCAFEAAALGEGVIEARCPTGSVARVGGSATACAAARTSPRTAQVLGACDMTVGELVACRIAVREAPCQAAGVGLRECDALRTCVDAEHRLLESEIEILERIVEREDGV